MTKKQENKAFVKMLEEFPKVFGRVSFRERLMLRAAFTYVLEARYEDRGSIVRQLSERCNQLLKDKGNLIDQLQEEINLHLHAEEYIKSLEQQIEKMKCCQNCKSEDNDYMEKPCCDCSRCLGDIKRKGTSDKWEIKENGM